MKILLTGATGFLGSTLWRSFLNAGIEVVALKRKNTNTWRTNDLMIKSQCYNIEINDVKTIFKNCTPDAVVHTACNYGRKGENIKEILEANLLFPLELIVECAKYQKIFVNTATYLDYRINEYTLSKNQLIQWLEHYSKSCPSVSIKIDHMYGPGDDNNKFIGWLLNKISNKEKKIDFTPGNQTRDFIHVDDLVELFILVLKKSEKFVGHNTISAGTQRETSIKDFVNLTAKLWEEVTGETVVTKFNFSVLPYRNHESKHTIIPQVKIAGESWKAKIELEEGLREYIYWYTKNLY